MTAYRAYFVVVERGRPAGVKACRSVYLPMKDPFYQIFDAMAKEARAQMLGQSDNPALTVTWFCGRGGASGDTAGVREAFANHQAGCSYCARFSPEQL